MLAPRGCVALFFARSLARSRSLLLAMHKWQAFQRRAATTLTVHGALDSEARKGQFRRKRHDEDISDAMADGEFSQEAMDKFYTSEAIDARCALRYDPNVLRHLRAWTRIVDLHAMRHALNRTTMDRPLYAFIFLKVSLALTAANTAEELRTTVAQDWANDCRDGSQLSYEQFKDALFEVADAFTGTTDADEYAGFLDMLLTCIYKDGAFLEDEQIIRASARPTGLAEDDELIRTRMQAEAVAEARARRAAAVLLQRQVRLRERRARRREERLRAMQDERRATYKADLLERAAQRAAAAKDAEKARAADLARMRADADAADAIRMAGELAAQTEAVRAVSERALTRTSMRHLGLLPAIGEPHEHTTNRACTLSRPVLPAACHTHVPRCIAVPDP